MSKINLSTFEQNLDVGWDYAVQELYKSIVLSDEPEITNATKITLLAYIDLYNYGYHFMCHNNPDDGVCFNMRYAAVTMIQKTLTNKE